MATARSSARGRTRRSAWLAVAAAIAVFVAWLAPAAADDHVAQLTKLMASKSEKTRLSAVLALAKLDEPEAPGVEKTLTQALHDPSVRVRAVAATALGRLECTAALPTLRTLAATDSDTNVRTAASNAAMKIAAKPAAPAAPAREARTSRTVPPQRAPAYVPEEPHPDLYLLVNSSADESPGAADKPTRQSRADLVKRIVIDQLRSAGSVTSVAGDAQRWGLKARHIDVSVTKLSYGRSGGTAEIDAELRIAISDDNGKMLSFVSGGAKTQVPSAKLDPSYLPELKREALENATRSMVGKLLAHLRDQAPS